MKPLIATIVLFASLNQAKADAAGDAANYAFWSYYDAYVSLVQGTGSYDTFDSAYETYVAAENAFLAETPEDSASWLATTEFLAGNTAWFAYWDYVFNPNAETYQVYWDSTGAMIAAASAID